MILEILEALFRPASNNYHAEVNQIYYRTKDGRADYGFSLEQQSDGSFRAYITSMPSYGSRNTSLHTTHRLTDTGRFYVCWNQKIYSSTELKQVVALWADLTQRYIKTGKTIDQQMSN